MPATQGDAGTTKSRLTVVQMLLCLNILFWVGFAVNIWVHAVPFTDRRAVFEEELPAIKFGRWALPVEVEQKSPFLKAVRSFQLPSYLISAHSANLAYPERSWEHRLGALSVGAYVLIGTMALSFVQWYAIGTGLRRMVALLQRSHRPRSPA